ncbi:MAG: DoxX family membrane protein [Chloroflexi bacterium]|nr:DoxX family membrane protein [Chloroflexota bacterium]
MSTTSPPGTKQAIHSLQDPPVARALFGNVKWAWIWLILRLYLGWEWLQAGLEKVQSPAWVGPQAGTALSGFIKGALNKTSGEHPDVQGWYAAFLQNLVLPNAAIWSYLVAFGELLVGIALILGIFTGIAAFFGAFMNANYLFAGTVSTNPLLLIVAMLLVLAWKTAGWWGLDRWVLPALGTPWRPGYVFSDDATASGVRKAPDVRQT